MCVSAFVCECSEVCPIPGGADGQSCGSRAKSGGRKDNLTVAGDHRRRNQTVRAFRPTWDTKQRI